MSQFGFTLSNLSTTATAFLYTPTADSNSNGIPDWWEDTYFGGPTNCNGSAGNGNGFSYLQDYLAGLNPRDPNSCWPSPNFCRRPTAGFSGSNLSPASSTGLNTHPSSARPIRGKRCWTISMATARSSKSSIPPPHMCRAAFIACMSSREAGLV